MMALTGCGLYDANSGSGGGGGGSSGGGSSAYCSTGYCYSYNEGICCAKAYAYGCKGSCYTYAGATSAGCYSFKTTCY